MTGNGVIPFRPLSTAEILDGAVRLVRANLGATLRIAAGLAVAQALLGAVLQYSTLNSKNATVLAALGRLAITGAITGVLTGLLIPVLSAGLLGQRLGAAESMRRAAPRVWALLGLTVIVVVAETVGLLACLVLGVWLWGIWAVAYPAMIIENLGVGAALGRSQDLVRGTFWRVWGIRALGWIVTTVLSLLVALPFEIAAYAIGGNFLNSNHHVTEAGLFVTVLSLGQLLGSLVTLPLSGAINILLYTDLRMRKEGMDIVLGLPPVPVAP